MQVAFLKDTIAKKDEEIERLQLVKDLKNVYQGVNDEKRGTNSLRYGSSSPSKSSIGGTPQRSLKLSGGKGSGMVEKTASDQDNCSDNSDKLSATSSQQSIGQNFSVDAEILGFDDAENEERLSDISDGGLSVGTDTDGSVESNLFPEGTKQSESTDNKPKSASRIPRPPPKSPKDPVKGSIGMKKSASGSNISTRSSKRWQ
ncbi:unnamed protein product [Ilex paraguariensis]|uniref:Uncharacterized protein n=1 Tax=Ilex paraguariensis TaxID=185542 RepID=A0ABC8RRW4_9AQUA